MPGPAGRVAVVGAGISGLVCARALLDRGRDVTVFDKGRGVGGRTATRRAEPGLAFDHGAQYFTARDPEFLRHVEAWERQGLVAPWEGHIVEIVGGGGRPKTEQPRRWVGVPGMTAVARHLAEGVNLHTGTRIVRLARAGGGWELADEAGQAHGPFDRVLVALPAPQAADLLGGFPLAAEARAVPMTPCWAVLAAFAGRVAVDWDGAFVHGSPLGWVARNSSKPGRDPARECWVLHATPAWSGEHREAPREEAAATLLAEFARLTAAPLPPTTHRDAHRWLYSATPLSLDRLALADGGAGLAVCGDWLAGGRVEGAYRSGAAAAKAIFTTETQRAQRRKDGQ